MDNFLGGKCLRFIDADAGHSFISRYNYLIRQHPESWRWAASLLLGTRLTVRRPRIPFWRRVCVHIAPDMTVSSALFVDVSSYSNTLMVPEQGWRLEGSECFRSHARGLQGLDVFLEPQEALRSELVSLLLDRH